MELHGKKLLFQVAVALATLVTPASAAAASIVPPENSAATQYTEAIPTGGGQQDAGQGKKRAPSSVLGSKKAKKLEAQGRAGRAAAQIAAETAPFEQQTSEAVANAPSTSPQGGASGDPGEGRTPAKRSGPARPAAHAPHLDASGGATGFGEVLGQAVGTSSGGEFGRLLPLLILGTLIWALIYGLRRKRPAA